MSIHSHRTHTSSLPSRPSIGRALSCEIRCAGINEFEDYKENVCIYLDIQFNIENINILRSVVVLSFPSDSVSAFDYVGVNVSVGNWRHQITKYSILIIYSVISDIEETSKNALGKTTGNVSL